MRLPLGGAQPLTYQFASVVKNLGRRSCAAQDTAIGPMVPVMSHPPSWGMAS